MAHPKHPHEPEIPPAYTENGRCLVCNLLVALDEAKKSFDQIGYHGYNGLSAVATMRCEARDALVRLDKTLIHYEWLL